MPSSWLYYQSQICVLQMTTIIMTLLSVTDICATDDNHHHDFIISHRYLCYRWQPISSVCSNYNSITFLLSLLVTVFLIVLTRRTLLLKHLTEHLSSAPIFSVIGVDQSKVSVQCFSHFSVIITLSVILSFRLLITTSVSSNFSIVI